MSRKAAVITAFDPYLFRGGVETYTLQILSLLETKGIEPTVYHVGMVDNGISRLKFNNEFIEKIYRIGRRLSDDDSRYDFIIANSYYGMGYFPPGVKTFNIYHSTYAGFIQKYKDSRSDDPFFIYRLLCEEMAEYVSGYDRIKIAVSDGVKNELESIYGFTDVEVVYCSVDTSMFRRDDNRQELRKSLGIPDEAFVGIFVGRWENMQKRSKIMEHVILNRPDIYWLLVLGTGGDECELESNPGVIVKRNVPHDDMHLMYSAADFMLFPSSYEGFGLVVIEAMACGLPVITTNVGVAPAIFSEKPFDSLLLPDISEYSGDSFAIINEKLDLLKESPELRKRIGELGNNIVREKFSIERWRKDMGKVLDI